MREWALYLNEGEIGFLYALVRTHCEEHPDSSGVIFGHLRQRLQVMGERVIEERIEKPEEEEKEP